MTTVSQAIPDSFNNRASSPNISSHSLEHLVNYFGSLDSKSFLDQPIEANLSHDDSPEINNSDLQLDCKRMEETNSIQMSPEGLQTKNINKRNPIEQQVLPKKSLGPHREKWYKRAFSSRFATWAADKQPAEEEIRLVSGLSSTTGNLKEETPQSQEKLKALTLPHPPHFMPTKSRSLGGSRSFAGKALTSLFLKESPLHGSPLENSVFSPHTHAPTVSDFPSIKDVEDLTEGFAQYSTLPEQWNGYKNPEMTSEPEKSPPPRTRWAQWKKARKRGIQELKGHLKSSLAQGKKRSILGLRVRFFAPSGFPESNSGVIISTDDKVLGRVQSP
ncbi:hypothetical protein CJJ07_001673 [Candidozyma auris]|nr:hypothetical protein CJJ07_001673 [[Candida] auris]QEL58536.1 hypothetical protein CJJ09_000576 [[Candida] auris]